MKVLENTAVNILKELKRLDATSLVKAISISRLVEGIIGINKDASPILFYVNHNKIKDTILKLCKDHFIDIINKIDGRLFYITIEGLNYIKDFNKIESEVVYKSPLR